MKKLTTLFILVFLAVGLFAVPFTIPKNYDFLDIENSIYFCDDTLENAYTLYSVVYKTDTVNLTGLHAQKKSLITDVEIDITVKFDTEEDLDGFLNYFYYQYDYQKRETPEYFNDLKDFISDLGVDPYYVMDENDKPKQVLYIANLTKK